MMYIKVDADGNPEGFPITYENVQYLVGVNADEGVTPEQVAQFNLKEIIAYHAPLNNLEVSEATHDIHRLEIVKNADGNIEQLWNCTEFSVKEKIRRWVAGPRASYLLRTDWTQIADAPLTPEQRAAWAEYRAKLRSITDDIDFSTVKTRTDFQWPDMPGAIDTVETKWADTPESTPDPTPPV